MSKTALICLVFIVVILTFWSSLPNGYATQGLTNDGFLASFSGNAFHKLFDTNDVESMTASTFEANVTKVSVITATPKVSTVNATAITTMISASTASVSIATTGGQQNYYTEAVIVIVIAVILGVIVFARRKKSEETSQT